MSDIETRAYSEASEELKRLKAEHEEMLLKHAREQSVALDLLEKVLEEVERYKALVRRAADALEVRGRTDDQALIAELRKAARVK